jgi:hypothetical protein
MAMAGPPQTTDDAVWDKLLGRVRALPPERQEEIIDYIGFILDKEDAEAWDLSDDDRERMARHVSGDLTDTVALADAEDAIRRGAVNEL